MSEQSNISTVQNLFAALNKGDLTEAEADFLHEEATVHVPGRHPLASKHTGKQDVLAFYADVRSQTEEVSFGIEAIAAAGDQVLVELHIQARRRGDSPAALDAHGVNVITFHDGKIRSIRQYTGDQQTLDTYLAGVS